ncbi:PREDICTED: uncharacterized protein LOC107089411 [Cyprinodon variegatus]|uniref:uncharacterized protein LOC107089411 n=1 Tax=Cyprinodon variegatus TaxID=28743 RepID=UPI0007427417|nr:PREDICTED: uncharacterized protein LOC107089411 [Cyprinodon variegatus]
MVMEDFPRQSITLTHNNGSHIVKSTSEAISQIPIQFGFLVDPAVPSCTKGDYLPGFLSPTPDHGAQFSTHVDKALEINIRASATHSVISELLYSGPSSVVKTSFGSGEFSLTWTPSAAYEEQSHPICFAIQASSSSSVYQSELRCVVVTVKKKPKPIFLNALRMKISTTLSLKDDRGIIENLVKEELLRKGFPPGISVRLMNNSSMIVK